MGGLGGGGGGARKKGKREPGEGKKRRERERERERGERRVKVVLLERMMFVLAFSNQRAAPAHVATGLAVFAYKPGCIIQAYVGLLQVSLV